MGNSSSQAPASSQALLGPDEMEAICRSSSFEPAQVEKIYQRFRALSGGRLTVTRTDMLRIPALATNPLADRILHVLDLPKPRRDPKAAAGAAADAAEKRLTFREFLKATSVFGPQASRGDKMEFAFRVYDLDGDGYVGVQDIRSTLRTMALTEAQSFRTMSSQELDDIARKTVLSADQDGDGKLSFTEFSQVFEDANLVEQLTLHL